LYTGDAKTESISLFPTSPGVGTQPCPFCGKVASNPLSIKATGRATTEEIALTGGDTNHANPTAGDMARLKFGGWTTTAEGIPLVTTQGGHRSTETLSDQASA
jgi:hypothetical protein